MRFRDIFARAWKSIWSPGSWGFLVTMYLAFFAVIIAMTVVLVVAIGASIGMAGISDPNDLANLGPRAAIAIGGIVGLMLVVMIPIGVVFHGGLIALTNELAEGRKARVGLGWSAGFRVFGRIFLIGLTMFGIGFGVFLILALPLVLVLGISFARIGNAFESGDLAGIAGALACGGIFYLFWLLFALVLQSWEALASRYAVILGYRAGEALSAGFRELKARFGRTYLLALALFGITFTVSIITNMITAPFNEMANSGSSELAAVGGLVVLGLSLVSMFVSGAFSLFQYSSWTQYFRSFAVPVPAYAAPVASSAANTWAPPVPPAGYAAPAPPVPSDVTPPPAPPVSPAVTTYAPEDAPIVDVAPVDAPIPDIAADTTSTDVDPIAPPTLPADKVPPSNE